MNVAEIEDKIIEALEALGIFSAIDSIAQNEEPPSLSYPSAFIYLFSETEASGADRNPRPVYDLVYEVIVINENMYSKREAQSLTYDLLDQVRDALNRKDLGITDINGFRCISRKFIQYIDGEISYALQFKTTQYLPVPTG